MLKNKFKQMGLESFLTQDGSGSFYALTEEVKRKREELSKIESFKNKKELTDFLSSNKLGEIVKKHHGLNCNFIFQTGSVQDPTTWDASLFKHHNKNDSSRKDFIKTIIKQDEKILKEVGKEAKSTDIEALIDFEKGKVSGAMSNYNFYALLGGNLFYSDYFEPEEVAAFILHEMGHAMFLFITVSRTVRFSYILQSAMTDYNNSHDVKERIKIINDFSYKHGIVSDAAELAKTDKAESVFTVLASKISTDPRSIFNSNIKQSKEEETFADAFSVRMGAGLHLTKGLIKIHERYVGDTVGGYSKEAYYNSLLSSFCFAAISLGGIGGGIAGVIMGMTVVNPVGLIVTGILGLLMINSKVSTSRYNLENWVYEDPVRRYQGIKREMIQGLKNPHLEQEYKTELALQIKQVDKTIATFEVVPIKFYNKLLAYFSPKFKKQIDAYKLNDLILDFISNDLFFKSQLLKGMNNGKS